MSDCPSKLQLDRLVMGELAPDAARALRDHVDGCERCRAWLERSRAQEDQLMSAADQAFAGRVVRRARQSHWSLRSSARRGSAPSFRAPADRARMGSWRFRVVLAGAAVALVAAVVVVAQVAAPPDDPRPGPTQIKGSTTIRIFRGRGGRVVELEPDDVVVDGDAVRFQVFSSARRNVLVLALEPAGKASIYYPFDGRASAPLAPGGVRTLPGSVILEGTEDELLIFVLSDEPIAADRATRAARRALDAAGGDLAAVRRVDLPGDQVLRLLRKGGGGR
jgi:hypothetical protein